MDRAPGVPGPPSARARVACREHVEGEASPSEIQFLGRNGNIHRPGVEVGGGIKEGKKINKIKLHYFLYLWKKTI